MKIATGPDIFGTMQLLMDWEIENGAPPIIIWQNRFEVSRFGMDDMSKVREVPTEIGPEFVTVSGGFAVTPTSHPGWINAPATART